MTWNKKLPKNNWNPDRERKKYRILSSRVGTISIKLMIKYCLRTILGSYLLRKLDEFRSEYSLLSCLKIKWVMQRRERLRYALYFHVQNAN